MNVVKQYVSIKTFHLYLCLFFLFISSHSSADIIYVDGRLSSNCTSGNYSVVNRNCSGSDANAYSTIKAAVSIAKAGDVIYIREHIYYEQLKIVASGTPTDPIIIQNYDNEKAIIDGKNNSIPSGGGLIYINNKQHVKIIGLTINDSKYYGIQAIKGCDDISIEECEVMYSNHGGIVFESSSNIHLNRCIVHHNNDLGLSAWHEAITMTGVNNFEIQNCKVYENGEEGIDAKYGSSHGSIHHNASYSNNGPNIYVDAANNIEIYNNRVYGTKGIKPGIMLAVEEHANRYITYNCNIYNNLIYDNNSGIGFWIESDAKSYGYIKDCTIINNTIHSNESNGGIWILSVGSYDYENIIIRNNILLENDENGRDEIRDSSGSDQLSYFTIDNNFFKSGARSDTYGNHYLMSEDVKLKDVLNNDYHPMHDSPIKDAGNSDKAPHFDYENKSRPYGYGLDIGAYEYSRLSPPKNVRVVD